MDDTPFDTIFVFGDRDYDCQVSFTYFTVVAIDPVRTVA